MCVVRASRGSAQNKDGQIERIELRQVVRNDLKINAENKEIDQIFDEIDKDGMRGASARSRTVTPSYAWLLRTSLHDGCT